MTVAFNHMPGDTRVSLFFAELNSGPPPYSGTSRQLLIGRKLVAGSATVGQPVNLGSTDPNTLFGVGSMLTDMAVYARATNPVGEIWALPVAEPTGTPATATGTIAITGPATAAGSLVVHVAGERYAANVASGDSATVVAAALRDAINAGYRAFDRPMGAPVVATASSGTVTLTARHAGTEGNGIRIEQGLDGDEVVPAGLGVTITAMANGTGDVDMAAALAALGFEPSDWLTAPYVTTTQMNAVRSFLQASGGGRWHPVSGLGGHYIAAREDTTLGGHTSFGQGRNDFFVSTLALRNAPHPTWMWAAALGGAVAFSKNLGRALTEASEIARPLQTIVLPRLRGPKSRADQWGVADRDSLYRNGMSAVTIGADGQARIDRVVTMYRTNAWGQPDINFLDIENVAIPWYAIRYLRTRITSLYPRHILKDENPRNVQGVVTPAQLRADIIHAYRELFEAALVEKPERFAELLVVERSADPNRVNAYVPIDAANQLRVAAFNVTAFTEFLAAA